jgi:hypothetical protein
MAWRAVRKTFWSKIQEDAIQVSQFGQFSLRIHGAIPNIPFEQLTSDRRGNTMMIVKPIHFNCGAELVDCHQRARKHTV